MITIKCCNDRFLKKTLKFYFNLLICTCTWSCPILYVCNQTKGKFSTFDYDFAPRDSIIVKFSDLWYRKLCVSINIYMYIMILLIFHFYFSYDGNRGRWPIHNRDDLQGTVWKWRHCIFCYYWPLLRVYDPQNEYQVKIVTEIFNLQSFKIKVNKIMHELYRF